MNDDRVRFRALYDETYPAVVAYARRRAAADDAADVVAETFLVAWRRFATVPAGRELPWLYGVARLVVANQRRGANRRSRLGQRLTSELRDTPAPEEPVDLGLRRALAALRDDDREILRLAAWEGLGAAEIAEVLGCTPNAASIRLHRARRRLRAALDAAALWDEGERRADVRTRTVTEEQ